MSGRPEEAADEPVELLGLEQERVVAEVGGELGIARPLAGAQECEHDLAVLAGGNSQSLVKATLKRLGFNRGKGLFKRTMAGGQVKVVEGARDVEVGIGVEAVDEACALMPQVAFHFKLDIEGVGGGGSRGRGGGRAAFGARFARCGRGGAGGFSPAELQVQALVGEVT